ncbi:MAG: hypothetical protein ACE5R4_11595 [Armatimonadota bacterium]
MRGLHYACVCAALLLACGAALAQHLTVDFAGMPIEEALGEIERQSGIRIIHTFRNVEDQPVVDVQMQDAPLRAVLRAICRQIDCYAYRTTSGYIYVREGPDPAADCPAVQVGPYTVRLRYVRITDSTTLSFERQEEGPLTTQDSMTLSFTIEADEDRDVAAVAAIDPALQVVDSTGNEVAPRYDKPVRLSSSSLARSYWGRVSTYTTMDRPSPEAVSLRTVEGDILVYTDVQPVRFEFPLDDEGLQAQSKSGHTVTLTEVEEPSDRTTDVTVEWQLPTLTPEERGEYWRRPTCEAYVTAAEGARIAARTSNIRSLRTGEQLAYEYTWSFRPPAGTAPERFLLEIFVPSAETKTLHYKFEDIPLPTWEE